MGRDNKNGEGYSTFEPSFADLPIEVIIYIFRYLDVSDVHAAGTTCQRWREATFDIKFTKKIQVRFSKLCLSDNIPPALDYIKSRRPFRNYHFEDITFGGVKQIMSHIGNTAEEVIFDNVDLGDKQFCDIMRLLQTVHSLTITRCSQLFMSGSFLENKDRLTLGTSFAKIRHLSLMDNQYLSDAILLRLTEMIDSIYTLDLSGCHIAYHNAIQRRFYPNGAAIVPSESILTFKFIVRILAMHQQHLRSLNLSNTLIGAPSLNALSELKSGGLRLQSLGLAKCRQINSVSLKAFLECQTSLLELNLSDVVCVNDNCLDVIVKNLPLLQNLNIAGCINVSNDGVSFLNTLKYLKYLNISRCDGIRSEGFTHGIASTRNVTLQNLQMTHLIVCEQAIKALAENFPELRALNLEQCVHGVTDESVQSIIKNLQWLRELSLVNCSRITDAALTGINITHLVPVTNSHSSSDSLRPDSLNELNQPFKISLRSKAEEEIVRDANRKKAMLAAYELNLIKDCNVDGYNLKKLRGLKTLKLSGCNKITDVSLKYGIKFLELRYLSLSNCPQISINGVEQMVQDCPSIETLDLSDCESINDKAIQLITYNLTRLRALHISGCSQLTEHSLDTILDNCKHLQTLSVRRCRHIYTDIEEKFAEMTTLRNLNMDNATNMDICILRLKKTD